MFFEVNPCFQKAHVFCMDLQPAADPYNVVCIRSLRVVTGRQKKTWISGPIPDTRG